MGIADIIGAHARHPKGLIGRIVVRLMARTTRPSFRWTAEILELERNSRVIEIGFGNGESLGLFARHCSEGHVAGAEVAATMLETAARRHRARIQEGSLSLHEVVNDRVPLPDGGFDRATSMNTVYVLPQPELLFGELFRLLDPGGRVAVTFPERGAFSEFPPVRAGGFHLHELESLEQRLRSVGFAQVERHFNDAMPMPNYCLAAIKPA